MKFVTFSLLVVLALASAEPGKFKKFGSRRPSYHHAPVHVVHRPVYVPRPVVVHKPVYVPKPVVVHKPVHVPVVHKHVEVSHGYGHGHGHGHVQKGGYGGYGH